jgi:ferredoxin-NADP reductase
VSLLLGIRDVLPATPRARIVRLDLGGTAFDYLAGQAIMIGIEGRSKRPYSIAISPEDARREACLELLVGVDADGSPGPHLPLERGRLVEVDGPFGTFTFPAAPLERRFVFIAGGTGIAPLRAMLRHALAIPDRRHVGLLYSARTPDEFAYQSELQALARAGRIELRQTVTRTVHGTWDGARGRIGRTELEALVHDPETLCFICGPPALVSGMSGLLNELRIDRARIRVEEWG